MWYKYYYNYSYYCSNQPVRLSEFSISNLMVDNYKLISLRDWATIY